MNEVDHQPMPVTKRPGMPQIPGSMIVFLPGGGGESNYMSGSIYTVE